MIWVVPCRFDPERPVVFDCVASIREHHPDDQIVVVDSDSGDLSYQDRLIDELGAIPVSEANRNYAQGAYRWAYEHTTPAAEFFALIHDSLIVNANLHHLQDSELTTVRWFGAPPNPWGCDESGTDISVWGAAQAREHMGLDIPGEFKGVFGPMWFCQRKVLDDLAGLGFFDILPMSAFEQQGMERLTGIALTHLGYDVTRALQGCMAGFFDEYDSTFVEKRHLLRA